MHPDRSSTRGIGSLRISRFDLIPVVFDHRVGEQAIAHLLHLRVDILAVGSELDFDQLTDPHVLHVVVTKRSQRATNNTPLGIQKSWLELNEDLDAWH